MPRTSLLTARVLEIADKVRLMDDAAELARGWAEWTEGPDGRLDLIEKQAGSAAHFARRAANE